MGVLRYIGLAAILIIVIGLFAANYDNNSFSEWARELLGTDRTLLAPTGTVSIENLYPTTDIDVSQYTTYPAILKVTCSGGPCEDVEVALEYPPLWPTTPANGDFETGDATAWSFTPPRHQGIVGTPGQEGPNNFSAAVINFLGDSERSELWQTFDPVNVEGIRFYHQGDIPASGIFELEVFNEGSQTWVVVESLFDTGSEEFPSWTEINIDLSTLGITSVSGVRLSGIRGGVCGLEGCLAAFYIDKICLTENGACVSPPRILVSDVPGDVPFYTIESNPQTTYLTEDEQTLIIFDVNATGNIGEMRTFLGRASNALGLDESNRWDVTITDDPIEPEVPSCHIFLDTPGQNFALTQNLEFNETCLIVTANDVTIDGSGFSLSTGSGESDPEDVGIYVQADGVDVRNIDVDGFGRGINMNSGWFDICSVVSNASDGVRIYYDNDAPPIDAALLIDVGYIANYAGGDASNRIFVGDDFMPFGRGTVSVPLTQNGNPIIDNFPGFGVPGLHVVRGQDGTGKFADVISYGFNGLNARESVKFRAYLMNANYLGMETTGGAYFGRYEDPFTNGCGIIAEDGDASDDVPTNDEIVITNSSNNGLIEDSNLIGNTERAIDVRGSSHVLRDLNILNSGNGVAFDKGGNNRLETSTVSGTLDKDILLLSSLTGRNYIIDTVLQGYQFSGAGLLTLRTTNVGEIQFFQPLTGNGASLANDIKIQNNFVEVSDAQQGLNKSANITLWNVPTFTNAEILRNHLLCDILICTPYTALDANPVIFGVSGWTNYSIGNEPYSFSFDMSPELAGGIKWNITGSGNNQHAIGNNGQNGNTLYWVDISAQGTTVDLYVKASGDLMSGGGDIIGLGNETYRESLTDPTVPGFSETSLSTNWALAETDIGDGERAYFKFLLDVQQGTRAGFYTNNVEFVVVRSGDSPP